jgi:hypothetical protein
MIILKAEIAMTAPINVTAELRRLAEMPVGESVYFPDKAITAARPLNVIGPIAIRMGGKQWVRSRREGDGYRTWKVSEPQAVV